MIHGHDINGVLYVDNSLLSAVAKCSTAAYLRYAQDLVTTDESKYLYAGRAVHKALECYALGGSILKCLDQVFQQEYEAWSTEHVPDDDRLAYPNVRRILARWFETHPLADLPFTIDPEGVERSYAVPLGENLMFTAKPDLGKVIMKSTGQRYTVDHKTTGRITKEWSEGFFDSSQVSGQVWVTKDDPQPAVGVLINAIELSKVPTSTRKCKDHGVPYSECTDLHVKYEMIGPVQRTPEQLERWKQSALSLAGYYRSLSKTPLNELHTIPQEGTFTGACTYCAYREFCRLGRPLQHLDVMFTKEPWEPFKEGVKNVA